jgi:hypothetical protein
LPADYPTADVLEYAAASITGRRSTIHTPAGFVVDLLRNRKTPPPTFEPSRIQKARQEAEEAQAEGIRKAQAAQQAAEDAETLLLDAKIEALPEADRLTLLSQAKAAIVAEHPRGKDFMTHYLDTHPESFTKDGIGWLRARRMVREGWQLPRPENSHYATNPPIRQTTPLQETAPVQTEADQPQTAPGYHLEDLTAILTTPQLSAAVIVEQKAVEPTSAAEPQPVKGSIEPLPS